MEKINFGGSVRDGKAGAGFIGRSNNSHVLYAGSRRFNTTSVPMADLRAARGDLLLQSMALG